MAVKASASYTGSMRKENPDKGRAAGHGLRIPVWLMAAMLLCSLTGCGSGQTKEPAVSRPEQEPVQETADPSGAESSDVQKQEENSMKITIGDEEFTAVLAETEAASVLQEILKEGPLTLEVHEYGGFEKTGPLGLTLPAQDRQVSVESGDIVLYQSDQISLFYNSSAWSYTPLARTEGSDRWKDALQNCPDTIVLSE